MRSIRSRLGSRALASLAVATAGCAAPRRPPDWATVHEATPAFLDSLAARDPAVAADAHGRVALTFLVTFDSEGNPIYTPTGSLFATPNMEHITTVLCA